ncbi:uncharacterized protein KY384_004131 [Bacidia gigantensis]|uniref:uncharacterized protein n=1 Tax=Bacidia gigantensis TaxID=2732470 RepID=UPI001D059918|nr:uncharacterized protein KY384_004131 [Bacidia gigantensis]KAG8530774.1 hypothetical protein KY384_004131 [Bacidia gigantensis]
MAPARTRMPKSSIESDTSTRQHTHSPATTPQRSPQKRFMKITATQKQALIDNLQLEVTERARKLRAQYAMQAQSLRSRIELRVNRIPTALRKTNMGELHAKHETAQQQKEKATNAQAFTKQAPRIAEPRPAKQTVEAKKEGMPAKSRGKKRNSDEMECGEIVKIHEDPIENPKKRAKANKNATTARAPHPSTVLSPKSANSRTLPQSPVRPHLGSPAKSFQSHATSPLKPQVVLVKPEPAASAAATAALAKMVNEKTKGRPKSAAGKRPGGKKGPSPEEQTENPRTVSSASNVSATSSGTTIVKPAKKVAKTAVKKKVVANTGGKRVDPPATGRRVLRKRG